MRKYLWFLPILIILLCQSVFATPDPAITVYTSTSDIIVSTPYIGTGLWYMITAIGLIFLILSNVCGRDQNPVLWAIIAPFFLGPSAYFTIMMRQSVVISMFNSTTEAHVNVVNVVTHPEWLTIVMGIVFIFSLFNVWYHLTAKPVEKTDRSEFMGGNQI